MRAGRPDDQADQATGVDGVAGAAGRVLDAGRAAVQVLRDQPSIVVIVLMALAAFGVAANRSGEASGDGEIEANLEVGERPSGEPLVARSGPSPGSSEVVRNDPLTPDDLAADDASPDGAGSDGANSESADNAAPTQEDDVSPTPLSPFEELRGQPGVVYATDFTELSDVEWEIYDSPGHAGLGLRRPSAITLEPDGEAEGGSVLTITARTGTEGDEAGQLVSGGMALRLPLVYGTYTFRIRVDPDPAQVTSGVAILWPWSNRWPEDGELDMFETWVNRTTRAPVESNIHYLDPLAEPPFVDTDDRLFSVVHSSVDGSVWHTYRFDWRADALSMAIDDGPMRLLTDDPLHIPDWLMVPTFQLDAFPAPGGTREGAALEVPVALEVDWLVIEE